MVLNANFQDCNRGLGCWRLCNWKPWKLRSEKARIIFFCRNFPHCDSLRFQQFRIAREEGVTTLWRGAIPTMGRAMVVNAAQLASYSQAKQSILQSGESCRIMITVSFRRLPIQMREIKMRRRVLVLAAKQPLLNYLKPLRDSSTLVNKLHARLSEQRLQIKGEAVRSVALYFKVENLTYPWQWLV